MADIPARLFQYPHNIGAGTVEMSVQSPFEPAGSGSHIAQTTKAGGYPTGSSRSVRRFASVTVKGYAANGLSSRP